MPQKVDIVGMKVASQVACGLEFGIALGQDYDQNGTMGLVKDEGFN